MTNLDIYMPQQFHYAMTQEINYRGCGRQKNGLPKDVDILTSEDMLGCCKAKGIESADRN